MKKIFFILLLLPVTLRAQKNYSNVDSLYKHPKADTINSCITSAMPSCINEGWINIQWLNNAGAIMYPDMKDTYRWDDKMERVLKGISIQY